MAGIVRKLVSKKKKRFVTSENGGFNLDLSYITDNLIAMGYPSQGREALYRNPMADVVSFLDGRHKDHYKVYNLCSERSYDPQCFYGRVAIVPFADHNAPPIELFDQFCKDAEEWLAQDPKNVVVTHCKAGKGRTGVMICAYLLYSKAMQTADEAFEFYGAARTYDKKGVTIPSQRRYVRYYEQLVKGGVPYAPVSRELTHIILTPAPLAGTKFYFVISSHSKDLHKSEPVTANSATKVLEMVPKEAFRAEGDLKLSVFYVDGEKSKKILHTWFNTFFLNDSLVIPRSEIEGAYKDKKKKVFASDFQLEIRSRA